MKRRCKARLHPTEHCAYFGRCDLERGHSGDHMLERGMVDVWFAVVIHDRRDTTDKLDDMLETGDVEVLREALWHAVQRGDISDEDRERAHRLRVRLGCWA